MNKLLGKKKAAPEPLNQETLHASVASPHTSPGLRKTSGSRWKKTKKNAEPKPSFDLKLAAALPPSDDFRTSLLMPNLSARFSMLREQDDPNSKLGKASDDSVLQPSRRSRMFDYTFAGSALNDIAEVQSINNSIRPPFAYDRPGSEDGYGSETDINGNDSIMSRARPGEGNTMFGGRQKVYKIAGVGKSGLGKAVYEDDIGKSTFQQWRQRERQANDFRGHGENSLDFDRSELDSQLQPFSRNLAHSPSLASDRNRSTTSSVARSDTRSSTAATSVVSQPGAPASSSSAASADQFLKDLPQPKRSDTKSRRLYETGLDQHIHDQQASAMTRLNSIQKNRPFHLPQLQTAKSTSNLHEQRGNHTVYTTGAHNSIAPMPLHPSIRSQSGAVSPIDDSRPQSPNSPDQLTGFGADDRLALALEPGDRGKATAMGAFNKPAQQFDERQYLERQQQLQHAQSRPRMSRDSGASSAQRIGRPESNRTRSNSNLSTRSRSRSASAHRPSQDGLKPHNGSQNNHFLPAARSPSQFDKSTLPDTHRTFFGNISPSDSEDEDDDNVIGSHSAFSYRGWQPNSLPSVSEHPALRQKFAPNFAEDTEKDDRSAISHHRPAHILTDFKNYADNKDIDSPTLGPASGRPLNGVMQHLRQPSNQSSIYPNDDDSNYGADSIHDSNGAPLVPRSLDLVHRRINGNFDTDSGIGSSTTHSNPWDLDDLDALGDNDPSTMSPIDPILYHGKLAQAQDPMQASILPWQSELRKQQHLRDGSSATQLERDAFASELAARRNAIQENMKSIVAEGQKSRNGSPARAPSSAMKALGKLVPKSSREAVAESRGPRDRSVPSKAKGLLTGAANNSTTSFQVALEKAKTNAEAALARDRSVPRPPADINTTGLQRLLQPSDWVDPDVGMAIDRSTAAQAHAQSATRPGGARSRSNSAVSKGASQRGRSSARPDDSMHPDGTASQFRQELTPRPSPDPTQRSLDTRGRTNSTSRTAPNGFYDPTNPQGRTVPPANVTVPPVNGNRTSPHNSAYSQNMTPPLSGANTPLSQAFPSSPPNLQAQPGQHVPVQRKIGSSLRKKSISKADISEPTLISSTSNVNTVELPPGASLKNGMDEPPPLPPINPKRRVARKILGMVRNDSSEHGRVSTLTSTSQDRYAGGRGRHSDSSNEEPRLRPSISSPNLPYPQNASNQAGRPTHVASPPRMPSHGSTNDGTMF